MSNTQDTALTAALQAHHALNPCETEQDKELSRKAFTAGYNSGIRQSQKSVAYTGCDGHPYMDEFD